MEKEEIIKLRKKVLENTFNKMNKMQREAVFQTEGPLLILAGAGSGKTTVLVNRISNILNFGNAYNSDLVPNLNQELSCELQRCADEGLEPSEELKRAISVYPARPWQILAITFTNKAAKELKERIEAKTGEKGAGIWAATFHSTCARILRRYGDKIGYNSNFTIYDTSDVKRVIKDCQKEFGISDKELDHRVIMNEISRAKDKLLTPDDYKAQIGYDNRKLSICRVYNLYAKRLKAANAMDFDDLLFNTVTLFRNCPEVLEYYQNLFRYIMVDEYQDTNMVQYEFIRLLAQKHGNICVVGDDDQSIYKFRGATIENILSFEKSFNAAKVIRLEQNYRSTKTILNAANEVISNNMERKGKTLWTDNNVGENLSVYVARSESDEAKYIADTILEGVRNGRKFSDFAILYRMNAQSNIIEQALARSGIPHRIIGGHRFYDREEIKDMTSYLQFIANPSDNVRLKRIINRPRRGIGDATVNRAEAIASGIGESLYEVIHNAENYSDISKARTKCSEFCSMMDKLIELANDETVSVSEIYESILTLTEYEKFLKSEHEESESRIENIKELKTNIKKYEEEQGEDATLEGFLEEISLITDIDNYNADSDSSVMMTLHSAKGLEFPVVFIPAMEDGVFPSISNLLDNEQLQEERRLAYVGITRAKEKLHIIRAEYRMLFGTTQRNRASVFLREIPQSLIEEKKYEASNPAFGKRITNAQEAKIKAFLNNKSTTGFGVQTSKPKAAVQSFKAGDSVRHKTFGDGMVISAKAMGGDTLLEIAFANVGTKKLMAKFANLTKI